ncbi:hypothetical protein NEF87_000759 [Candidatus Lokiarchaeum ossiferum]|uniref:Uncharacterized protein n=1 Tax=Candidatus Lokiarchaeum ossiferum TaxID=2951803 RepID=A0ABY6HPT2_9ARCH|nr:hypothetical protein NEF87_000759 [Candidatus Lokiarchaeum sp. B-35]
MTEFSYESIFMELLNLILYLKFKKNLQGFHINIFIFLQINNYSPLTKSTLLLIPFSHLISKKINQILKFIRVKVHKFKIFQN